MNHETVGSLPTQLTDDAVFDCVIREFSPRLHRYLVANGTPAADADDLVQETFVRAHRHRERYDATRGAISTWLFTIATRLAANQRRDRRNGSPLRDDLPAPTPGERDPLADTVWATARAVLAPRDFQVLWLRFAEDLDHEAIALALDLTPANARVVLHRAKDRLAAQLGENRP